jgi:octaprenyl-diphosphate synthase
MKDFLNGLFTYPLILLKSKITPAESKEIDRIMGKDVRDNNDIHLVSGLMDKYIIKKAILDGLKKTANSLNKFLSNFKQSPHRKLMMERIEMIVED